MSEVGIHGRGQGTGITEIQKSYLIIKLIIITKIDSNTKPNECSSDILNIESDNLVIKFC